LPAAQNGKMGRNGAKTPAIECGESVDFSHGLFFGAVASLRCQRQPITLPDQSDAAKIAA
jgi:hypothetical protein